MEKIKVFIIENDHKTALEIAKLVDDDDAFELLCIESNPANALNKICYCIPDLVFLGIEMPHYSGFEVIRILRNRNINPLVVFTASSSIYGIKAIKTAAFDYFVKPVRKEDFIAFKERLLNLGKLVCKQFSEKEQKVIDEMLLGKNSLEISTTLKIAPGTVNYHKDRIFKKTGVKSTSELLYAFNNATLYSGATHLLTLK